MTTEVVLLSVAAAIAAGLIGSFAVMRGMSLAADPLSHVALPGLVLLWHCIASRSSAPLRLYCSEHSWSGRCRARLERRRGDHGVVFSAALAIGSFSTSGENLIDALFGGGGTPKCG